MAVATNKPAIENPRAGVPMIECIGFGKMKRSSTINPNETQPNLKRLRNIFMKQILFPSQMIGCVNAQKI
jgi:hypothetical protein